MGPLLARLWPFLRLVFSNIMAFIAVNVATAPVKFAIAVAVVTAWGVFLGIVTTGLDGLELWTILSVNPLGGMGADMYALFCSIFPFAFFFRLWGGYVLWSLSFQAAAWVMMKAIRFLFGG